MKMTRRHLFPAAAGAAAAIPRALQQVYQGGVQLGGPPPMGFAEMQGLQQTPTPDPNWAARRRANLLDEKSQLERWARGEFTDDDLDMDQDPRYPRFATEEQGINSLKSVSAGHKVRMAGEVARRRYVTYRRKSASEHLDKILWELAKL